MRVILAFFGIAILAMVALAGVQASLEDAGTQQEVVNETWTPDAGNYTVLNESERNDAYYNGTVTVYDENKTKMSAGSDYEWNTDNGTVKAVVGGDLEADANATITYRYLVTTQEQRQMAGLLTQIPRVLGLMLPIGAFLTLLIFARGG